MNETNEKQYDNTFTQKDLLVHLLNATNHAATREELQQVKAELREDIKLVRTDMKHVRDDMSKMSTRLMTAVGIGFTTLAVLMGILVKQLA